MPILRMSRVVGGPRYHINFGKSALRLTALALAISLTACVGREKLAGEGVRTTPLAAINAVSAVPVIEVHDVLSRGGAVRVLVEETDDAVAVAILFAGGRGATHISDQGRIGSLGGNFLIRSRHAFRRHGFTTVVFDSPSVSTHDLRPFHHGQTFANDVGKVIHHLRRTYGLPVWVIGTSRGTVAVGNVAARLGKNAPDGVVFSSSLFDGNRTADVYDLPLEDIQAPSLIVHHREDGCLYTLPGGVNRLRDRLTGAKRVGVMWFEGGYARGNPCQARGYHGFNGIEDEVIAKIAAWIKNPAGS